MRMEDVEVHLIREKAYQRRACGPGFTEHEFESLERDGVVLLILCRTCGRTPLEALGELPLPLVTT